MKIGVMKLDSYLRLRKQTRSAFAAEIGVSPSYITMIIRGRIWPSREVANRIVAATDGAVTSDDFLQVEVSP